MSAIAIIAAAGRFPGARDVETFWRHLCAGTESIRRYDADELAALGVAASMRAHPRFVPAGALLDDVDRFDAALFGFTPRDAEVLDPQHRLFFEIAWEVLERAGYVPGRIDAPVGVFAGTSLSAYLIHNLIPQGEAIRTAGVYQAYISNDKDSLTTHVAYKLNLKGPCVTVQTACSTSLVAAHLACQSLLAYQCDMALAGGVSLQLPHQPGYVHQDGAILSSDGRCRAFDARADGTVSGSGAGVVLLKRLEDAREAGDTIVAVIRGGAVNNDGAAKVGYTAPSVDGQAEVIAMAQAVAEAAPDTIGYVEAHGTGTPLGDPIEVEALTRAFRAGTARRQFCALGSVKTNIGHLDAAAGVAGLIKAALAVQHGVIPPSLHFERPNPHAKLPESPFFVPTTASAWPIEGTRRAAVSSFGIGGTNAHLILEEAPAPVAPTTALSRRGAHVLTLSARSEASLDVLTAAVRDHLAAHPEIDVADAAFTLQVGRRHWPHRRAYTVRLKPDTTYEDDAGTPDASVVSGLDTSYVVSGFSTTSAPPAVSFMFPGQGTQSPGMARALYASEPRFRAEIDACCATLEPLIGFDLRDLIVRADPGDAEAKRRIDRTAIAQPALFAVEYALARLWMAWGVRPAAMIGHSLGEYVAACLAGVFTRDEALRLVAARGRLMQQAAPGAMLAVALGDSELAALLPEGASLAAVNGARSAVASGPFDAIDALAATLADRGVPSRRLETSHAFHSAMMDGVLAGFDAEVRRITLRAPQVPFVSNVTGRTILEEEATDPKYWVRHVRATVRFADGLRSLPPSVALEAGPGQVLSTLARQLGSDPSDGSYQGVESDRHRGLTPIPDPIPSLPELEQALGRLWVAGVDIDWAAYQEGRGGRRVLLPPTPFERQRYWIDPTPATDHLIYRAQWEPAPLPAPVPAPGPLTVLVLGTPEQGADRVTTAFRSAGHLVLRHLDDVTTGPVTVCDLTGVAAAGAAGCDRTAAALEAPLALARRLSAARVRGTLLFVVNRLYDTGTGASDPQRALVTGPALVIPQEYPDLRCRIVDLDAAATASDGWLQAILAEATTDTSESIVAWRGGVRLARGWYPRTILDSRTIKVRAAGAFGEGARAAGAFAEHGVYWITGASGGIGRALAQHLAARYRARLLLTSRTPLAPDVVAALETAGATVVHAVADVSDAAAMRAARDAALARFGRIDGIVHTAGVPGGGLIALRDADGARAVLAPKVAGTEVVAALGRETPVRFIALCSSIAALQGGLGQVEYVAANAFLDAFAAAHSRSSGIFTLSVNWDAWRETGMAVAVTAGLRARAGIDRPSTLEHGLATADAIAALERALDGRDAQVAISTVPLDSRIARHRDATRVMTAVAGAGTPATGADGRSVDTQVAAIWERVLGVGDIADDRSFFEVGGDSLKGVQLVAQLNEHFALDIPVARFFEAPTVQALAALVRDAQGDRAPAVTLTPSQDRGRLRREARRGRAAV